MLICPQAAGTAKPCLVTRLIGEYANKEGELAAEVEDDIKNAAAVLYGGAPTILSRIHSCCLTLCPSWNGNGELRHFAPCQARNSTASILDGKRSHSVYACNDQTPRSL